jgi:hypothetical protein
MFYYIIYLAGLFEISVCPKEFSFGPLVGTKKIGSSHLALDCYKESPIYYYIHFVIHG